ncbi:hypothetical protein [Nocardia bovistercoris]|uniref:Uncharacterized protein n=1 Tax=Nocardia bovistercoris TaxID=2785916 RepID=A0A931IAQ2_9NOCA|nr:hypothetical protein [Nocardia bovistercoris]MBH0777013.1 hypothetical protein [Nocardia bovistercoris]
MPFVIAGGTVPFEATSMNKNGTWQLIGGSVWTQVPTWTADTTGYPGSVVVGNALQISGNKSAALIQANLPFSGGFSGSAKQQARILVDGAVVATGSQVTGTSGTLTASATVDVGGGSVVTVEAWTDQTSFMVTLAATSYVRVT